IPGSDVLAPRNTPPNSASPMPRRSASSSARRAMCTPASRMAAAQVAKRARLKATPSGVHTRRAAGEPRAGLLHRLLRRAVGAPQPPVLLGVARVGAALPVLVEGLEPDHRDALALVPRAHLLEVRA